MLRADQVHQRGSLDSYASSQQHTSVIQRTDSKLLGETLQPTYSSDVIESPTSLSRDSPELAQTASVRSSSLTESSGSTTSTSDGHTVRVRTKGHDLKSGFPYHPGLFDMRVRPDGKSDGKCLSVPCQANKSRLAAVQRPIDRLHEIRRWRLRQIVGSSGQSSPDR